MLSIYRSAFRSSLIFSPRGFKKITEEFERANLPFPTIEENGGGVMAVVMRKVNKAISDHVGVKSDEIMVYTS